jgi:RHS repeat-associated protein
MYYFILLWLFTVPLFAEEQPDADSASSVTSSLVNMTAMPNSIVAGVNVITGDFMECETEHVVSGPDPYTIGHTYVSSSLEESSLGDGWNFIHEHLLTIYQPAQLQYTARDFDQASCNAAVFDNRDHSKNNETPPSAPKGPSKKEVYAHLDEPFGGRLIFEGRYEDKTLQGFKVKTKNSGFTNVSSNISAQTNIKNIRLKWNKRSDSWNVFLGDGTHRIYKKADTPDKFHRNYHLVEERKPSGNRIKYSYNHKHELEWMRLFGRDESEISYVHFNQKSRHAFERKSNLKVENSDNLDCYYDFVHLHGLDEQHKKLKDCYAVSGINRPGRPYERFIYDEKSDNHIRRLERKECENGNFVEIKYYRPHRNEMGDGTIRFLKDKDAKEFNQNRVRYLVGPGNTNQAIRTHAFYYYKDGKKAGHTNVYDALNQRTRYCWNEQKRLTKIERYNQHNKLQMVEKFTWGKGKEAGFLLSTTLLDEDRKPKCTKAFTYDSRGNVLTETVTGAFTQNHTTNSLTTTYTYSKDRFNLKTSQVDPDGNYTYYQYVKNTNLLKAKFVCDKKKICKREFYRYDTCASLIESIIDDGTSWEKQNLSGVTERHIVRIIPRKQRPHYGEAEVTNEYYYDVALQKELLLKKTVNHFSKRGFVKKQEIFDSDNTLASTTQYKHDDVGRVTYIQEPSGRIERLHYDTSGRLCKKELHNSTYCYFYDVLGRVIREEEQLPNKPTLVKYFEYDLLGRKIKEIDPQNNETLYEYDALNRVTKITYPAIYDEHGHKISPIKRYSYEKLGTIVTETNENGYKTTRVYSAAGKIFEEHLPDKTCRFCRYDKKGNLVLEIAPNGTTQKMSYDAFNRLTSSKMTFEDNTLSKKTLVYNSFRLIQESSPTLEVLRFTYDSAGRKKESFLNNILKTSYHYDSLSRLSEERTYYNEKSYFTKKQSYDSSDRIVAEHTVDDTGKTHGYKYFDYDYDGNCIEVTVPVKEQLAATKMSYLAHGQISTHSDALGNTSHYEYDFYYPNAHGQRVCKKVAVDPRGVFEEEIFDARGNLSQKLRFDPMGTLISKKELFYDAAGNCTCTLEYPLPATTAIKTRYFYGPNNRLEKIVEAAETSDAKTTTFVYNSYGQKEQIAHGDKTVITTLYDKKGRVEHCYSNDSSLSYSYIYDESDKIRAVINNSTGQKSERFYNEHGELISEALESGLALQYSYDNAGRLATLTLPDESLVSYSYSPVHLAAVLRNDWKYVISERDLSGKVLSYELPHSAGTLHSDHDLLLRKVVVKHEHFTQENIHYDAVGNLLQQRAVDTIGAVESTFSYDFLSQLTTESGNASHSYVYNALYDRLECDDKKYEVNSLHSTLSDGTKKYGYDLRGNRNSDEKTYHYDALDRLTKVVLEDGSSFVYSYDAFNRRMDKTSFAADGTQICHIRYLYALENEIGAVDDAGVIVELRILGEGHGAEIGSAVALELQGKLFIPLHDTRGNVVSLLDKSGSVVESYRFDAFGNETIYDASGKQCKSSPVHNPWRFSSKRFDDETGFVYFGRRYYDPALGTWLTMDPLGLKAGPNLYAYVLNNPMTFFDLYGLMATSIKTSKLKLPSNDLNNSKTQEMLKNAGYEFRYSQPREGQKSRIVSISLGREPMPGASILYINGTNTPLNYALADLEYLSNSSGGYDVELCYNMHVNLAFDLVRCHLERMDRMAAAAQYDFRECCNALLGCPEEKSRYIIAYGFSEGAIILRNALAPMPREQTDKILTRTVCPGAIIQKDASLDVKNYVNRNPLRDPVPWTNVGGLAKSIFTNPSFSHIEFFDSHEDAPLFDHSMQSPSVDGRITDQFLKDRKECVVNE